MKYLLDLVDLIIAWTLIVGVIVLMCFRPECDLKEILIMAGSWVFGRGYSLVRTTLKNNK